MTGFNVEAQNVRHLEKETCNACTPNMAAITTMSLQNAKAAAEHEHRDLGVVAAFRAHWKAALWSIGLSTALVMEGYDVVVINCFYGSKRFIDRFGTVLGDGKKVITAPWQTGLSNSALVGEVIVLLMQGWLRTAGLPTVYMASMIFMSATIFIPVFANSLSPCFRPVKC